MNYQRGLSYRALSKVYKASYQYSTLCLCKENEENSFVVKIKYSTEATNLIARLVNGHNYYNGFMVAVMCKQLENQIPS